MEDLKQYIQLFLEADEGVRNVSIDEMGLSAKVHNALLRGGYRSLKDFVGVDVKTLQATRNFGDAAMAETLDVLSDFGLSVVDGTIVGTVDNFSVEMGKKRREFWVRKINYTELTPELRKLFSARGRDATFLAARNLFYLLVGRLDQDWDETATELAGVIGSHDYKLDEYGSFVPFGKENVLLANFKKEGLFETLALCEPRFFAEGSLSMQRISEAVEKYYNWLVEQKLENATPGNFKEIEKDLELLREAFKSYVEAQRQVSDERAKKQSFARIMAVRNAEVKRYHHKDQQKHEEGHFYNPFAKNDREF